MNNYNRNLPDPEQIADQINKRLGNFKFPVDLERLLSIWSGLKVSEESIEKGGYLIDLGMQGGEIIVKNSDPDERRRFTIAHEIGHWILSREHNFALEEGENIIRDPSLEEWCNNFAAALLMPKDQVLYDLKRAKISGLLTAVTTLPDYYKVSHEAFRRRVSMLTSANLYVLKTEKRKVLLEQTYKSEKASQLLMPKALKKARLILSENKLYNHFIDAETKMHIMYRRLFRNREMCKWIIGIHPSIEDSDADLEMLL